MKIQYTPFELCAYDIILCTLILQHVHLGFDLRKIKLPGFKDDSICTAELKADIVNLIRSYAINKKQKTKICEDLVSLIESHEKELGCVFKLLQEVFKRENATEKLLEFSWMYLKIYDIKSAIEICKTKKYNTENDACVVARSVIPAGSIVKGCRGILSSFNSQNVFEFNGDDLSLICTPSCESLFLGPARFINHDCDPNCKLLASQRLPGQIRVAALREIQTGSELTISYGKHYFKRNNEECMCSSCERKAKGIWGKKFTTGSHSGSHSGGQLGGEDLAKFCASDVLPVEDIPENELLSKRALRIRKQRYPEKIKPKALLRNVCAICGTERGTFYITEFRLFLERFKKKRLKIIEKNFSANNNVIEGQFPNVIEGCRRCERHFLIYKAPWPRTLLCISRNR